MTAPRADGKMPLPAGLRRYFWDCDDDSLVWTEHRDFIIGRLLCSGGLDAVRWLRGQVGDEDLRQWILDHRGRGMDPRRLRFWELVLDLPEESVDEWVQQARSSPWWRRQAQ